jgi:hypothetical protein
MSVDALRTARGLAQALDGEDYAAARQLLAENCVYHTGKGVLTGADPITASYRANGDSARKRFDAIEYASQVEPVDALRAVITYTDRVRRGEEWHEYRCRQQVRVDERGRIVEIRHEELPGERERLEEFAARHLRPETT